MRKLMMMVLSGLFILVPLAVHAEDADDHEDSAKVEERLSKQFDVPVERVKSLREQGLGYGEVKHALNLAKGMPGGITDENVNKVMTMRQGGDHKQGWGKIRHELNGDKAVRGNAGNAMKSRPAAAHHGVGHGHGKNK